MPLYYVALREINYGVYQIEADGPREAVRRVLEDGDGDRIDTEYGDTEDWDYVKNPETDLEIFAGFDYTTIDSIPEFDPSLAPASDDPNTQFVAKKNGAK